MSKHTPEPWVLSADDFIVAESDQLNNGEYILSTLGPERSGNAKRIVACVNALAGLTNEQIDYGVLAKIRDNRDFLVKQNAELVAALRDASEKMRIAHSSMFEQCCSNPITNAWGKEVDVSAINDLQLEANRAIKVISDVGGAA